MPVSARTRRDGGVVVAEARIEGKRVQAIGDAVATLLIGDGCKQAKQARAGSDGVLGDGTVSRTERSSRGATGRSA
jgi:hypothetical protein